MNEQTPKDRPETKAKPPETPPLPPPEECDFYREPEDSPLVAIALPLIGGLIAGSLICQL